MRHIIIVYDPKGVFWCWHVIYLFIIQFFPLIPILMQIYVKITPMSVHTITLSKWDLPRKRLIFDPSILCFVPNKLRASSKGRLTLLVDRYAESTNGLGNIWMPYFLIRVVWGNLVSGAWRVFLYQYSPDCRRVGICGDLTELLGGGDVGPFGGLSEGGEAVGWDGCCSAHKK